MDWILLSPLEVGRQRHRFEWHTGRDVFVFSRFGSYRVWLDLFRIPRERRRGDNRETCKDEPLPPGIPIGISIPWSWLPRKREEVFAVHPAFCLAVAYSMEQFPLDCSMVFSEIVPVVLILCPVPGWSVVFNRIQFMC